MVYINPYELLSINTDRFSKIDAATIKRATKQLLADIELSDSNTFSYYDYELNKSDCLKIIDELDNIEKKEFHFIIFHNVALKMFLISGDMRFFVNYKTESIYKNIKFIEFLNPYFSKQYDTCLFDNFINGNIDNIKRILLIKPIVTEEFYEKCYISLYTHLRSIDTDITVIAKQVSDKNSSYINCKFEGLQEHISNMVNIDLINLLPSYFQGIRNQIALSIRTLARDINNDPYFLYDPAFQLIRISFNMLTDGLAHQTISAGYYTIKKNYDDDLKNAEIESQKDKYNNEYSKYNAVVKKIDSIIEEIKPGKGKSKNVNFRGLPQVISLIINIKELNSLPDILEELRYKIVQQIDNLSFILWKEYEAIDPALKMIKIGLEIKVDSDSMQNLSDHYSTLSQIKEKIKTRGKPIDKAPSLGTINGVGTKIYEDTLYFTFLYIPIIPIARYSLDYDGYLGYTFHGQLKLYLWQRIWIFLLLGGIISLITLSIVHSENISSFNKSFRVVQNGFTNNYPLDSIQYFTRNPYLLRKTLLINMDSKSIDELYDDLPDSLKANSVDEVNSIIQIWRDSKEVGKYSDGASALQSICNYRIIDLAKNKAIYGGTFLGSMPPESKQGSGSSSGSQAIYLLRDFLYTLPKTESQND